MPQMTVEQAIELALQHQQAGNLAQAESIHRQVLSIQPNQVQSLHLLGIILLQTRRLDEAENVLRRAIAGDPSNSECHRAMGQVLASRGRMPEAIGEFRHALASRPNSAETCNDLGNALLQAGQVSESIAMFRQAIAIRPEFPQGHANLGNALQCDGRNDEAIEAYRRAIALRPDFAEAHYNLGNAFRDAGQFEEAIEAYRRVLELQPQFADAQINLGTVLREAGRFDDAIVECRAAVKRVPNDAMAHSSLAVTLLLRGEFDEGFREYEWRSKVHTSAPIVQEFTRPRWKGEALNGKRILVHAEQGFGDTIQFVRYLPAVRELGGRIILQCQTELVRLFENQSESGLEEIVTRDDAALPDFDVHCPLLSLPIVMKTTFQNIPSNVPYLRADPEMSSRWRERLARDRRNIGLCWAGKSTHKNDSNRSIPLQEFSALKEVAGAGLISLQKPTSADSWGEGSFALIDWTSELDDFADTAALIDNLDLVITVDTSIAHLAGAMGKPVWVLLPFVPDWRWLLNRDDSPWYPTMRLFRQSTHGDWRTPIQRIAQELEMR